MHIGKNIRVTSSGIIPIKESQIKAFKKRIANRTDDDVISINVGFVRALMLRIELDHGRKKTGFGLYG